MRIYDLHYFDEDAPLATWTIPDAWQPYFGSVLAVPFQGKLTMFRVIGGDKHWTPHDEGKRNRKIILDFVDN